MENINIKPFAKMVEAAYSECDIANVGKVLDILWKGFNLFHTKKLAGQEFSDEEKDIVSDHLDKLVSAFSSIITKD